MKIAITGGTGFLGKYVIEKIKEENNMPVILTRSNIGFNVDDLEYRVTDYSKNDLIYKLHDIDALVHLAAKRGSQGNISEFLDNLVLTQNLYDACCELEITNIVFASTISIYSVDNGHPFKEEELPAPELMYGVGKMTCEYIGNIYSKYKGLYVKNLRFAHLFGFNEKNNYMINLFLRQAFNKQTLTLNGKGTAKREFLYAKDAAKAIVYALNKPSVFGSFNIGSGESFTNYEVATTINKIFNNLENLQIKDKEETIKSSYMDSSKARDVFGFTPDYTFVNSLTEIYTLMKELDYVPILY